MFFKDQIIKVAVTVDGISDKGSYFKMNLKIQTQNSLICHSTQVTVEACVHIVLCFMTTIGILGVEEINEQEK